MTVEGNGIRPVIVQRCRYPERVDEGELLDGFTEFATQRGLELYDHQLEAILELYSGNHVILNTPTGSGKSLVGAAVHYASLKRGQRSYYTAPIKALVSEKFFSLSHDFGAQNVGMVTGDASINPDAPIICCTAEILANIALREGSRANVDQAVVDEFHYYADPQRGWAWQVPLLELSQTQFCLMSATLGPTKFFEDELTRRSNRTAVTVKSVTRPVPLTFEYRRTTLHASVLELLESDRAPIYIVHFTQREATEAAQSYLSMDPLTKEEKARIKDVVGGFRFDTPIGKDMRRWIMGGIGVHHAGLLPKYRLLVEKLAQEGLLKIICGTDTLGVGVNVPIRTVLFTQLCKYDGDRNRLLSNREFKQIAGRAGRRGFDTEGHVWVQAPPHVVENLKADEKASSGNSKKKPKKKQAPDRRYTHWTEDTFTRMVTGEPEPLTSSFDVTHQMMLNVLDRDGDGCGAMKRILRENHETDKRKRGHQRQAIRIYRSLRDADLLEFPDEPDERGRRVRVTFDVQENFALNQPLSLWAIEAIDALPADGDEEPEFLPALDADVLITGRTDEASPAAEGRSSVTDPLSLIEPGELEATGGAPSADDASGVESKVRSPHHLRVLTIVEAVQENPGVIIAAQLNKAKDELMADMKSRGVEYEERMERLAEVRPPQPDREAIYRHFDEFRLRHPYVGQNNPRPKSVVREMLTEAMTVVEYINFHGLKRSEGVLLRYLSDVYKGLIQNVPMDVRTPEIEEIIDWLGVVIRTVDSSLIDEWESLRNPEEAEAAPAPPPPGVDFTQTKAFAVLVRNRMWKHVEQLAFYRPHALPLDDAAELFQPYWDEHNTVMVDADARAANKLQWNADSGEVIQIISDPEGYDEWRLTGIVDLEESNENGEVVLRLSHLGRMT
ncbi:MAG: DUF3516 domain-containing protein [Acidimicrobiales bacterium]|nr:DUF3516 domain-containing protein [Acidimicrobiales bacterium]